MISFCLGMFGGWCLCWIAHNKSSNIGDPRPIVINSIPTRKSIDERIAELTAKDRILDIKPKVKKTGKLPVKKPVKKAKK